MFIPKLIVLFALWVGLQMDDIILRIYYGDTMLRHPVVRYIGYKVLEKRIDKDLVTYWMF